MVFGSEIGQFKLEFFFICIFVSKVGLPSLNLTQSIIYSRGPGALRMGTDHEVWCWYGDCCAIFTKIHANANFDPAFWKYGGAQAKIEVYYPRHEVKIL